MQRLFHGRLDMGGPAHTAWDLVKVWPDAELTIVEESGHTGSETVNRLKQEALDALAR